MVLNIDVAPTILELAGLEIPAGMQGRSLVPILEGYDQPLRDEFFYEHQFIRATWGHKPYIPGVEGVVQKDIKLMHYLHGGDTIVYTELFDRNAPDELNNLADEKAYQELRASLQTKLDQYKLSLK
jgi:arylsulfatase A-like enzyme